METVVVYSPANSTRLKFVLDWVLRERMHINYTITTNEAEVADLPFFISYGKALPKSISIPDEQLLWGSGIQKQDPKTGSWHNIPTLFESAGKECTLPFDMFSAVFFLLSRYEEYYAHKADKHGRYPATQSILYKKSWLQRPLVDEWITTFRKQLVSASGMHIAATHFMFQPTYDIDMAYSHLYKGVGRIMGAYVRALLKGDVKQINERTLVLKKKQKDPYDSFRWLRQLHKQYELKPLYFVLCSFRTTLYDKNVHPEHPAMMRVIKNLAKEGTIGTHPSYYHEHRNVMENEKRVLEQVSGKTVHISRQHYMRVKLPHTYRMLQEKGITEDYSMGYGSHLGFRAGTGNSFHWYDVEKEEIMPLRIYPFCFMDTTAHYESKLSVAEAFAKLDAMAAKLRQTGSTMITVFHNFSLGTSAEWKGWRNAYDHFIREQAAALAHHNVV